MFKKKPALAGDAGQQAATAAAKPLRRLKLILALVLVSLLALGGGLVAAIGPAALLAMLSSDAPPEDIAAPAQVDPNPPPPGAELVAMPFDEMIVNITAQAESGRQTSRFLKVDLALVYDRRQDAEGLVELRHIFLRDAFQDYLRQLADRDLEGTHGLVTVKGELLRRARAIVGSDAPHELVITGLVIQ